MACSAIRLPVNKLENYTYYIDPDINLDTRTKIGESIKQLEFITGSLWLQKDLQSAGLKIYSITNQDAPSCDHVESWVGCASFRNRSVSVRPRSTWFAQTVPVPPEILVEVILHEMLHAVLDVGHTNRGVMCNENCIDKRTQEQLSTSIVRGNYRYTYTWYRKYTALDKSVYRMYAHESIKNGMDLADIKVVIGLD